MDNSFDSTAVSDLVPDMPQYAVPDYLQDNYWWAYVHPRAVNFWDRQWLVNLILLGNYKRLCGAVLDGFDNSLPGRTIQISCAYGDITPRLSRCVEAGGMLDVIDILRVQLDNLAPKLSPWAPVTLHQMDSTALKFADGRFDRALLFFLMHEQPMVVRKKTLAEALRVVRPGGTITIVDFARPYHSNLFCRFWTLVLTRLEPFAPDMWKGEIRDWLPKDANIASIRQERFFGGFFQKLTITLAGG